MARSEARAEKGLGLYDEEKYGVVVSQVESKAYTSNAKPFDFVVPILSVIVDRPLLLPHGHLDGRRGRRGHQERRPGHGGDPPGTGLQRHATPPRP
ncbi:MAG: hypothetical protein MZU97_12585 [Bacillus subtilis]|nr:hypothetical protein [Bacillus subtilis]